MGQAIRPSFKLQNKSFVIEMKGFLGREVACVKEILFPRVSPADGRMPSVFPEDAASSQVELSVEVSYLFKGIGHCGV